MIFEEEVPKRYDFFPHAKLIKKVQLRKKYSYDVAMIVDCGDLARIGKVEQILHSDKPIVNIDHHITNTKFGDINYVVDDASSTAEILFELLEQGKVQWNKAIATNLYAGIMTDTGSFRYENTTSKTHAIVSELLKQDFSTTDLFRNIYERIPVKDLTAFTQVINGFESYNKGQIVCVTLTKVMQKKFSDNFDLRDAIFKYLRAIEGVEVIFIVTEVDAKTTRVNFRSTHRVDVAKIAGYFHGGGHQRASGCQIDAHYRQARVQVLKEVRKKI